MQRTIDRTVSIKGTLPGTEPVRRKELVDMIEAPGSLRVTVEPLGLHETRVTVHEFDDDGTSQFLADAAGILTQEPNGVGYVFSMDPQRSAYAIVQPYLETHSTEYDETEHGPRF